jgi:hypothetical protein
VSRFVIEHDFLLMNKVFFILIIFATTATALAQTNVDSSQVIILKSQLQTMRDYDRDFLAIILSALGTVGVVAVLLVGYSWFTNIRIYERDKSALTQELEGKLESKFSIFKNALEKDQRDFNKELLDKATKPLTELEARLVEQNKNLKNELAAHRLWIDFNKEQSEAHYWETRKDPVPANELNRYKEMLLIAIKLNSDHHIAQCLARIEKLMAGGSLPYWGELPRMFETLDSLAPKFTTQANAIKEHLKKVKET